MLKTFLQWILGFLRPKTRVPPCCEAPLGLSAAIRIVTSQPGELVGGKPLMYHEGLALERTLKPLERQGDDRFQGLVEFLQYVDPLKGGGWSERQFKDYIQAATETVAFPGWLTRGFDHLACAQREVAQETGNRLFRTTLLQAALAYFMTGLHPDDVELPSPTGSDARFG